MIVTHTIIVIPTTIEENLVLVNCQVKAFTSPVMSREESDGKKWFQMRYHFPLSAENQLKELGIIK